jgi:hypothetical protein
MDQDRIATPPGWVEALARSEAELARGERVSAQEVHDALRAALVEMEAELAAADETPIGSVLRR